jgi:hypothetical protein
VKDVPTHVISLVPNTWENQAFNTASWSSVPVLSPFYLADGNGFAKQQTHVRLAYSAQALYVRFDCEDDDIWGTYTQRDDPLYDEEVVEVFIASGTETPTRYFEFEVSPHGVVFDCTIDNPSGHYDKHLVVDATWNAEGLEWHTQMDSEQQHWWAVLVIPWQAVGGYHTIWRANFYRIERSRTSGTEFSCWSPTHSKSFHVPARFGTLELAQH